MRLKPERKTRLERRLACVCLSRSPLSRLRRQLPRGASRVRVRVKVLLTKKKRPPEGNLFLERKTRLERRLACVCLSRSPLSRLRRQLPRGASRVRVRAKVLLTKKRDHPKAISFWSGKRDSNSRPQPWQGCALPTELFPQTRRICAKFGYGSVIANKFSITLTLHKFSAFLSEAHFSF